VGVIGVASIRTPTFYFEGERSGYVGSARQMERLAQALGVPFQTHIVAGGDHFSILQPLTAMVARKIKADTGPRCAITITPAEVSRAFAARVPTNRIVKAPSNTPDPHFLSRDI